MARSRFPRLLGTLCVGLLLLGCGRKGLDEPPVDLGPFKLGLNIVVADNMQKVPISREATVDEWETGLKKAVADRFGRYDGDRFYNIGINVDGYALAPPGIPVVAAPKSVVVVSANIWDDATATRLNDKPKQLTVFENLSGASVVGSGYTSTKEEQLAALAYNVAQALEKWFLENPQWFDPAGPIPGPPPVSANAVSNPTSMSARALAPPAAPAVEVAPLPATAVALPTTDVTTPAPAEAPVIRPVRRPASLPAN